MHRMLEECNSLRCATITAVLKKKKKKKSHQGLCVPSAQAAPNGVRKCHRADKTNGYFMATVSTAEPLKSQTETSRTFIGRKWLREGLGITKLTGRKKR